MVDLVGIGGREFSVGRMAGCRSRFNESTLTALGLSQPEVVYTNWKMQINHGKHKINAAATKTHHEIHSNPATATTSRRRATKRPTR